jgi:tol-pal system protein YbgF
MELKTRKDNNPNGNRKGITLQLLPLSVHSIFLLSFLGCATQASMVEMELEQERNKLQQATIEKRLRAIEGFSQERTTTTQREQTDLFIKLDELSTNLQALQGGLEESTFLTADLSQRLDDQAFHIKELADRLDILDRQVVEIQESVGGLTQPLTPGVQGQKPDEKAPGAKAPLDKTVVLPGRSTGQGQTSGLSPSEAYGLAYNDYLKGNYDLSLMGFKNFLEQYETTSLAPNAQYWIGESYYGKQDYLKAIEAFQKVITDYPNSNKVSGAILKSGYAYIEMSDIERAKASLRKVIEGYPFSNEAELAKKRLSELK